MDDVLRFLPLVLIVLACPLGMATIGAGAWFIARVRGEKKDLSLGCMSDHAEHSPATPAGGGQLEEQVARLESQLSALKAGVKARRQADSAASTGDEVSA